MSNLLRAGLVSGNHTLLLDVGWQLTHTRAGLCADPGQLAALSRQWHDATVPGTVAASLHHDIDKPGNYDRDDWWYRLTFAPPAESFTRYRLHFGGLASLARVWLNGAEIVSSDSMFVSQHVDVTALLRDENQLVILFQSLEAALAQRRPRPRWKTALVEQQNLRWFRTTLLGRIPGWTPPITPVGPWRPVALECIDRIEVVSINVQARAQGAAGHLKVSAVFSVTDGNSIERAALLLGNKTYPLEIAAGADCRIKGELTIPDVPLWWPHTHGAPQLLKCALELQIGAAVNRVDCGSVGFKEIRFDESNGNAQFIVNGAPIFCRGACWTVVDFVSLTADVNAVHEALEMARDAGMNMLRIGGTMLYESDDFYRVCDELGILVWQDFMFANMDYPVADAKFRAAIETEVAQQIDRVHKHVCIAAYCGSSEIAQQAAMLGLPASDWTNDFFADTIPRLVADRHQQIPYFPSTPWGGALPFHIATGISHYFGVGAYRRPLADARIAGVKFTTECLGFSNVPDAQTMALMLDGKTPPPHHPRWKERQPRDSGAGWDFEDIRDHYLRLLSGIDPVALRSQDVERYYAVSRVVTGEVMQRVFSEWRNPANNCAGGLMWFFKDFWPGAGWGLIDSTGRPKAALWFLKRAWAPVAICFTDEGLDGMHVHVLNESADYLEARIELEMFHGGRTTTSAPSRSVRVAPRGAMTLQGDELLGYFSDSTAAYRFGPPKYDVITVRLRASDTGLVLSEDFYFPLGLALPLQRETKIDTFLEWQDGGGIAVTARSDVFLQAVSIFCDGFVPDDNYFHLAPGQEKRITFSALDPSLKKFRAHFEALNVANPITVRAERPNCDASSRS